jgi:hypothetical protein
MDNDKSLVERITETVKDIANIAASAADQALKAEQAPAKTADQPAGAYIPLAADGLVSDPMLIPPVVLAPARKKKRAAPKRAAKAAKKARAKKAVKKTQAAKKKTGQKSKAAKRPAKKAKNAGRSRTMKAGRTSAKKAGKKARKARR